MIDKYRLANLSLRLVPGNESVTLRSRTADDADSTYTDYTVVRCKFPPTSGPESTKNGVVVDTLQTAQVFIFQEALDITSAPNPKVGDLIRRGDGTSWVVRGVTNKLLNKFWSLDCSVYPS